MGYDDIRPNRVFQKKSQQESHIYARESSIQFCLDVLFKSTWMDTSMERQNKQDSLNAFCLRRHI